MKRFQDNLFCSFILFLFLPIFLVVCLLSFLLHNIKAHLAETCLDSRQSFAGLGALPAFGVLERLKALLACWLTARPGLDRDESKGRLWKKRQERRAKAPRLLERDQHPNGETGDQTRRQQRRKRRNRSSQGKSQAKRGKIEFVGHSRFSKRVLSQQRAPSKLIEAMETTKYVEF